jgi:hypothetical protein
MANRLDQQTYYEISDVLSKISNKTYEVKKKNLKYMNKLGQEVNEIIFKAQEVVKACLFERQGTNSLNYLALRIKISCFIDDYLYILLNSI